MEYVRGGSPPTNATNAAGTWPWFGYPSATHWRSPQFGARIHSRAANFDAAAQRSRVEHLRARAAFAMHRWRHHRGHMASSSQPHFKHVRKRRDVARRPRHGVRAVHDIAYSSCNTRLTGPIYDSSCCAYFRATRRRNVLIVVNEAQAMVETFAQSTLRPRSGDSSAPSRGLARSRRAVTFGGLRYRVSSHRMFVRSEGTRG